MNPVFELANVTYRYPESTALDGLDLSISEGESLAIVGANGSGKSTLLRVLAGLCFPNQGRVEFRGQPLTEEAVAGGPVAHDFRRRVGMVFQNPDVQLFNATVFDEVAFGPAQMQWSRTEIIERVNAELNDLGIYHLKDRAPHRLSGGEKKRVALASVLVLNPEVLLMDEPTAALDPQSQAHMVDFLFGCAGKKTVITTTHSLEIVDEISSRCIVLEKGRLVGNGTPCEVLQNRELLERTHLLHVHRHRHPTGAVHTHAHWHQ